MTMRKSTILVASFIFLGLTSCNTETETPIIDTPEPALAVPAPVNELSSTLSAPPAVATLPITAAAPALKINPAHGQPGHDCAVAVGAPLTGTSASTPAVAAPVPVLSSQPATAFNPLGAPAPSLGSIGTASTANLNPAHGKPGHDCAVAVGAPLPGSAVPSPTTAPARVQNTSTAFNPLGAPAPKINTNLNASSANLNPAHGKPGHDCAVAVGAPLPSK